MKPLLILAMLCGSFLLQSCERRTSDEDAKRIEANLSYYHAAALQFLLESGKPEARYQDLVGEGKLLKAVPPIRGEDYQSLIITANTSSLTVKTKDGREVTWKSTR